MNIQNLIRSILIGLGTAIGCIFVGILLDYSITQLLSQFFLNACSEECYFRIFNILFVILAFLSLALGLRAGIRSYKRL
jgi:hypothetical protein